MKRSLLNGTRTFKKNFIKMIASMGTMGRWKSVYFSVLKCFGFKTLTRSVWHTLSKMRLFTNKKRGSDNLKNMPSADTSPYPIIVADLAKKEKKNFLKKIFDKIIGEISFSFWEVKLCLGMFCLWFSRNETFSSALSVLFEFSKWKFPGLFQVSNFH